MSEPRRRGRPPRAELVPVGLSAEEEAHVKMLHEKTGGMMSVSQLAALFTMSLGRRDANGRAPSSREQLGASTALMNMLVARPKPIDTEREDEGFQMVLVNPYGESEAECPVCGHKFNHTPTSGPGDTMDDRDSK